MSPMPSAVSRLLDPAARAESPPSPAWQTGLVLAVVAVGGSVLVATSVMAFLTILGECEIGALGEGTLAFGPTTVCLCVAAAWTCVRKRRAPSQVKGVCMLHGGIAGALTFPANVLVLGLVTGAPLADLLVTTLLGGVVGVFVGAPLGILFGAVAIPPIRQSCHRDRSLEHRDRAVATNASWLAALCGFSALLSTVASALPSRDAGGAATLAVLTALIAAAAAVMSARARIRLAVRKAWVARVRRGEVPGWSVVSEGEAPAGLELRPFLSGRGRSGDILVCHDFCPSDGAYRSGMLATFVATV